MTTVPPAVTAPAQDIISGSSLDGSTVATPQPNFALEVKKEGHPDSQAEDEDYEVSNGVARPPSVTCTVNTTAGNILY